MIRPPSRLMRVVQIIVLVIMSLVAIYPVYFAILASGRGGQSLYTFNVAGMFFPVEWTWSNFQTLFFQTDFLLWVVNSLKVAVATVILSMIVCTSAAFAF